MKLVFFTQKQIPSKSICTLNLAPKAELGCVLIRNVCVCACVVVCVCAFWKNLKKNRYQWRLEIKSDIKHFQEANVKLVMIKFQKW